MHARAQGKLFKTKGRGFEQLRNSIVFDTNGALKDKPKDRTI